MTYLKIVLFIAGVLALASLCSVAFGTIADRMGSEDE